jgi:hypothetical protein
MAYPSAAFMAQGTKLNRETSWNSAVFNLIEEVRDLTGPSEENAITEVTNHDSQGAIREWINGLIDPGKLGFKLNATYETEQTNYYADFAARTRGHYQVVVAGGHGTYTLTALPTKHDKVFPSDGKIAEITAELKITGLINYAP